MSAPFSSNLVVAKRAPRIAWVTDIRGERNVYTAETRDVAATLHAVTQYSGDTGQPIAALAIVPDGSTVVYALGSESNGAGRAANPAGMPVQPKQQVWAAATDGKSAPKLLGDLGCDEEGCEDIQISPDGRFAVWPGAKKQLWAAALDGSAPAAQLTDILGSVDSPRWSPDAQHLVFRVARKDHALIAIGDVGVAAASPTSGKSSSSSATTAALRIERLHWIAPSTERDQLPRWSPDGKKIAFVRTAGQENRLPIIPLRVVPWSIWVAETPLSNPTGDVADNVSARQVWQSGTAERDTLPHFLDGGFFFAGEDRIVFVSDQDGWPHLYSISSGGGTATLLTPGAFSIEDVALGKSPSTILFSANKGDLDARHIWSVSVTGGDVTSISASPVIAGDLAHIRTIEWTPVQASDGSIFALGSTFELPGLPVKIGEGTKQRVADRLVPADFPAHQLVAPKQVIFSSEDGLQIHGQLFQSAACTAAGRRCPALIFTHGGASRQMLLGWHYMDYYANAYAANQFLASRGFVVLSVNYRLGVMYGHDFFRPEHAGWRGAAEYKDVVAGAKFLQALPNVDPQRVGLWGGSYGGYLTALGLARNSDIFKAGVDYHGVHDWSVFLPNWENDAKSAPDLQDAIKLALASSPVSAISTWRSPVLLIQGDDDRNVPFDQTVDLAQRLKKQKVAYEEIVLPDEIHGFLRWASWVTTYDAMEKYFARTLK